MFRILHFSDIHAEETIDLRNKANLVVDAVLSLEQADKYCIIVSGDLVSKGSKEAYTKVKSFIQSIVKNKKLKRKVSYIDVLYAPGNHDISFSDDIAKELSEFEDKYSCTFHNLKNDKGKLGSISEKYLKCMKDFYKFCEPISNWTNPYFFKKELKHYNNTIGFVVGNSAPFSLMGSQEEDKGFHYFDENTINEIKTATNCDLNIYIMHHSIEWFSSKCKNDLLDILSSKYRVFLFGHEHNLQIEDRTINKSKPFLSLQAPSFNDNKSKENGFDVIDLDFDKDELLLQPFIEKGDIYIKGKQQITKLMVKYNNKIDLDEEFANYLYKNEYNKQISNTYVFPRIIHDEIKGKGNNTIESEEKFYETIEKTTKIRIIGAKLSGKTTLAKRIYLHYISKGKIPILINKKIRKIKANKIIRKTFNEQYECNETSYDRFEQLEPNDRVLIIDDVDCFDQKNISNLLQIAEESFGKVILLTNKDGIFDIEKTVSENIVLYESFTIEPLYYKTRYNLIKKVIDDSKKDIENSELLAMSINDKIGTIVEYSELNPEFVTMFTEMYLESSDYGLDNLSNSENVFSEVYEFNIKRKIMQNSQEEKYETIKKVFQEISYTMHFLKKTSINQSDITICVNKIIEDYGKSITTREFLNTAVNAEILEEKGNEEYMFINKYNFAYFIASAINRKAGFDENDSDRVDAMTKFNYLINNLCFGINSDIILYLFSITKNTSFIKVVIDKIEQFYTNIPAFDLDNNEMEFLNKAYLKLPETAPSKKEKEDRVNIKSSKEKRIVENNDISVREEYDYDETDVDLFYNKILIGLKLLDIVGKALPAFLEDIKVPIQQKLSEIIYNNTNKFVYMFLNNINQNYDELVNEIMELSNSKYTQEEIQRFLSAYSALIVLSVYNYVAKTSSTNKSIEVLNKFLEKDINKTMTHKVQNLLMRSNIDNLDAFTKISIDLDKQCNNTIGKYLIRYAVREYLFIHKVPEYGKGGKMLQHFYGNNKKKVYIENIKNNKR